MEIKVVRNAPGKHAMTGTLYVNGEYVCHTLEDIPRKVKVKGETAIPSGRYQVIFDFSDRFQKYMPHILNVPYFDGIRIHSGNTDHDTEGCLLLGLYISGETVVDSVKALTKFLKIVQLVEKSEKIFITYEGGYSKEEMSS